MKKSEKTSPLSRAVYSTFAFFARIFYRKMKIVGMDELPIKNTVIVSNHAQLNGPFIAELCMPESCYIWANGQMFAAGEVPDYAMEDFFPFKPKITRPIFRAVSYILALLIPPIVKNARAVPVYRDTRIVSTFRTSMRLLAEGRSILIFPECHTKRNNIVNEFEEKFVDIARLYYKRNGVELKFVPMHIAPEISRAYFGEPPSIIHSPTPSGSARVFVPTFETRLPSLRALFRSTPLHRLTTSRKRDISVTRI